MLWVPCVQGKCLRNTTFFDSHYDSIWTSKMNYIDSMFLSSSHSDYYMYLYQHPYIYHVHGVVYSIYIHLNICNMYTVGTSLIPLNFTLQSCFHFRNSYLTSQQNPKRVAGQNTPSSIVEFSMSIPLEKEGQ